MKNSSPPLVPWYEQTHCSCTAFVFSVPMACVVDHDISRNESWRLINLGHLEWEGRALPIFYHIRCISVVPLLFIYFIKDEKKNGKGFIEPHWLRSKACGMHSGRAHPKSLSWHYCRSASMLRGAKQWPWEQQSRNHGSREGGGVRSLGLFVPKVAGVDGSGVSSAVYCFKMG